MILARFLGKNKWILLSSPFKSLFVDLHLFCALFVHYLCFFVITFLSADVFCLWFSVCFASQALPGVECLHY